MQSYQIPFDFGCTWEWLCVSVWRLNVIKVWSSFEGLPPKLRVRPGVHSPGVSKGGIWTSSRVNWLSCSNMVVWNHVTIVAMEVCACIRCKYRHDRVHAPIWAHMDTSNHKYYMCGAAMRWLTVSSDVWNVSNRETSRKMNARARVCVGCNTPAQTDTQKLTPLLQLWCCMVFCCFIFWLESAFLFRGFAHPPTPERVLKKNNK